MKLSLYIDEQHVETIPIPASHIPVSEFMADLRSKYEDLIKQGKEYRIFLENVPLQANNFNSLMG